ncbi:hypothetical protein C8Q80DRAFT_1195788 [Daedaleopsis nitida]|nr:hypothetical protein C8Q80DRAFT_1195788 [Daedaleopsis nitida]
MMRRVAEVMTRRTVCLCTGDYMHLYSFGTLDHNVNYIPVPIFPNSSNNASFYTDINTFPRAAVRHYGYGRRWFKILQTEMYSTL